MKNKFIRVIQPLSLLSLILLISCSAALLCIGIKLVINNVNFYSVCILIISITVLITAVVSLFRSMKNGVTFDEAGFRFSGLDGENEFGYFYVEKAEGHRDAKASFKKSFTDRYSSVILHLNDGSAVTVELGYTTKRNLDKIVDEINKSVSG